MTSNGKMCETSDAKNGIFDIVLAPKQFRKVLFHQYLENSSGNMRQVTIFHFENSPTVNVPAHFDFSIRQFYPRKIMESEVIRK